MADVQTKPNSETAGNLPKTAADAGHIAVYDNDSTDGRPASVLDAPTSTPQVHKSVAPSSNTWLTWTIGIVLLAVVLFFVFRVLF